ncbi:MAG: DUF3078 domain-containing protein [Bacteroidetes bacterium]|jgi:hypothetical protein|nr:DUF3078 domain-containing protein [Bacteroidota bacterium]
MRIIPVLGLLLLLVFQPARAQAPADSVSPWKHSLVAGLTATQVSFKDWAQGGENAFSWASTFDGKHLLDRTTWTWGNTYKLAYGQAEIGTQGVRKTDDKIDIESMLTYKTGVHIDPYFAVNLKSQFSKGYLYRAIGDSVVSDIFDPAYFTQSAGVGYQPIPEVKTRLGAALREVVTSRYAQYADDPTTAEIEKIRVEGGLESVTSIDWKIEENVLLTSKLELFSAFHQLDVVIVRNDNTLSAKVSKYLTVNLNVQLINDRVISPRTQVKQTIAFGFSYVLI